MGLDARGGSLSIGDRPQDTALPEGNRSGGRCHWEAFPDAAARRVCAAAFRAGGRAPVAQCEKLRGPGGWPPALRGKVAGAGVSVRGSGGANNKRSKQLVHRLPAEFVRRVLKDFNQGVLGAADAAARLEVSRARLYQLRTGYLRDKAAYCPQSSGGARREQWPAAVIDFLTGFAAAKPSNYQLVADELLRLCQFRRARSTVEAYVKAHLPHLVATPPARPKGYRRFRRAHVGELWQHDSSLHQWWPAASKQTLVLSIDDCSGLCVAGSFVERDTTGPTSCTSARPSNNTDCPRRPTPMP